MQRLGRLSGVEFWSISDTERRRTVVTDSFSACLVLSKGAPVRGWAQGSEKALEEGSTLLAERGEVQQIGTAGCPVSLFVIRWPEGTLRAAAARLGLSLGFQWKTPFLSPGKHSESMKSLYQLLSSGASSDLVEAAYFRVTKDLLLGGATPGFPRRSHGGHPTIRRALERMKAGLSESASLDELAAEAGLSKFHFARSFRRTAGLAPHQYRKLLRIEQARRLLEDGLSVTETAQKMGFADASHLVRSFRDCIGVGARSLGKSLASERPEPREDADDHRPASGQGSGRCRPAVATRAGSADDRDLSSRRD